MIRKTIAALAIGASALAAVAGTAEAGDWNGRGGYGRAHGGPPPYAYHHERRNRTGEKIAKGVAIGVGAVILGSILANEARRNREYRDYRGYEGPEGY